MRVRISFTDDLPAAIDKGVAGLRRSNGIHHDAQITARGILHTDGSLNAARRQSVLLIFYRTRADRNIGKQVGKIAVVFGIQHLVRTREIIVAQSRHVQLTDGNDALVHIGLGIGIGLMKHALISLSRGSRLVGIDTGNDDDLILDLILYLAKTGNILQHRLAVICGARTDDQKEFIRFAFKYRTDLLISCGLHRFHFIGKRIFFFNLLRDRELSLEIHTHGVYL